MGSHFRGVNTLSLASLSLITEMFVTVVESCRKLVPILSPSSSGSDNKSSLVRQGGRLILVSVQGLGSPFTLLMRWLHPFNKKVLSGACCPQAFCYEPGNAEEIQGGPGRARAMSCPGCAAPWESVGHRAARADGLAHPARAQREFPHGGKESHAV